MRGGFGRYGAAALTAPGQMAVPPEAGGNATQGRGIYFSYATPLIASLAAGASSGAKIIQFDNNSTFTWLRTCVAADIAGAVQTPSTLVVPLVNVTITDTGNGMSFMNGAIPITDMAGDARLPFILPVPQFIQPNASYSFNFTNYSAATTYANLQLILIGMRVFG